MPIPYEKMREKYDRISIWLPKGTLDLFAKARTRLGAQSDAKTLTELLAIELATSKKQAKK
jgi:hypothetical protein